MRYALVTPANLDAWLAKLAECPELAFDFETTGLNIISDDIVGVSIGWDFGVGYFPLRHAGQNVDETKVIEWFRKHRDKVWYAHNASFEWCMMASRWRITLDKIYDTMVMAHLTDTNRGRKGHLNLKACMTKVLKWGGAKTFTQEFGGRNMLEVTGAETKTYGCKDSHASYELTKKWLPLVEKMPLWKVESELVPVVAKMSLTGVPINTHELQRLNKEFQRILPALAKELSTYFGDANLNSAQQLVKVLKKKGVTLTEKTDKGAYKLNADVLTGLSHIPACKKLLVYREMSKLYNTFVLNLLNMREPSTGRVHPSFNQVQTCSGRFSCSKPNMQNMPSPKEGGYNLRGIIGGNRLYNILAVDYRQIEVKVLLALAQSPAVSELKKSLDMHTWLAGIVFGKNEENITKGERQAVKTITFGLAYGMSTYTLSKDLGIPEEKAEALKALFFNKIKGVQEFISAQQAFATEKGYVSTAMGRIRRVPEVWSRVSRVKGYGLRVAVNHVIQGTAADIIKMAMVRVDRYLNKTYPGGEVRMIMTVHDELVFEVSKQLPIEDVARGLVGVMTAKIRGVTLDPDAEWGPTWGALHAIDV